VWRFWVRNHRVEERACNLRHARRPHVCGVVNISFCETSVRKPDVVEGNSSVSRYASSAVQS
jgi:hypothetical protein